ncbi:MAG TPA: thioredoxin family protein [Gaiellaceae bacterium]|nr:thioredoxin family protein [Gaiellaceae bacterium]
MIELSVVARILVGLLLLWAAAAKLRRRDDLPDWLAAYGLPARLARPAAWGVMAAEAVVGVLLLAGLALPASAYAAVGLGVVFVAALAQARLRGVERLRCGCFGASEGRTTLLLLRAGGFTALAALAAFTEGSEVSASRDTLVLVALGVLTVAVAVLALLVLALYRQVGVLTLRIGPRVPLELAEEGPDVGAPAPALEGLQLRGAELVAFFSPGCRLCRQLAPGVAALARQGLAVRVVEETEDELAFERWNIPGTPFVAHLVDGVVAAKGTVNTLEEVEELLATGGARVNAAA